MEYPSNTLIPAPAMLQTTTTEASIPPMGVAVLLVGTTVSWCEAEERVYYGWYSKVEIDRSRLLTSVG